MSQIRAAVLMGLTAVLLWGAEGRRKLGDLDLSTFVNHKKDMAALVWGIRFSPDETKVAIGFGPRWDHDSRPQHVVVVAVDQPQRVLREFEPKSKGSPLASGSSIAWSPSGRFLVAKTWPPAMLTLGGEAPCMFSRESEFGGFLSGDRMVIFLRGAGPNEPTEIRIVGPDCSLADSWKTNDLKTSDLAEVLDTSPEQDLLAIETHEVSRRGRVFVLVTARTHEVKQNLILDAGSGGGLLFSNQGRLICGGSRRKEKPLPDLACWDTQKGVRTAGNDKIAVAQQSMESSGGDLLAVTDYKFVPHPILQYLDLGGDDVVPRRRLIWNVRTGEEVASWGVLQQRELWGEDKEHTSTHSSYFVVSLSPTGKYIAEGGSGSVSIYAVQP